jgi:hypothetical protein
MSSFAVALLAEQSALPYKQQDHEVTAAIVNAMFGYSPPPGQGGFGLTDDQKDMIWIGNLARRQGNRKCKVLWLKNEVVEVQINIWTYKWEHLLLSFRQSVVKTCWALFEKEKKC